MASESRGRGPSAERVRDNIKALRRKRGLDLADLSQRLGDLGQPISVSGLSKLELGQRRVDVDDLVALALVLDVSPNRLLLPAEAETIEVAVTRELSLASSDLWAWATGDRGLQQYDDDRRVYSIPRMSRFAVENRPHDPRAEGTPFGQMLEWEQAGVFKPLMHGYAEARRAGVPHRAIVGYLDLMQKLRDLGRRAGEIVAESQSMED
jgi:transcriptional regulator with XRE-family HTH domain